MFKTIILAAIVLSAQASETGKKLKVCTLAIRPFTTNTDGQLGGFIPDLLEAVAPLANITYSLTLSSSNLYGVLKEDGTWTGLVGQVIDGTCDIAAADLVITSNRESAIDFTLPFYQTQYKLLTNKQSESGETKYLVIKGGSSEVFLKSSELERHKNIWQNVEANNGLVGSFQAGVEKVLQGGYSLVTEAAYVNDALKANEGKLQLSNDVVFKKFMGLGVKQGSPLRKQLSIALAKLNENGKLDTLWAKYQL